MHSKYAPDWIRIFNFYEKQGVNLLAIHASRSDIKLEQAISWLPEPDQSKHGGALSA